MWLFALFVAVPLIEIALFIQVGGWIGLWPTLLIVVLTAALGTYMVRSQGIAALRELQSSFETLRDPTKPLAHGAMILFSGALLLTPGFFTDAVGFALLVPAVREAVMRYVGARIQVQTTVSGFQTGQTRREPQGGTTIETDYEVLNEDSNDEPGNSGWTKNPDQH